MHDPKHIERLRELTQDIGQGMLVTHDTDLKGLRARAMSLSKFEDNGKLWFFTRENSDKVREIYRDRDVCLTFSDPSNTAYVSITGRASIVDDAEKKRDLWSPILKAWFDGPDAPDTTLLCVRATHGEYWKDNDSRLISFAKILSAAVTEGDYDSGENAKVKF